MKTYEPDTIKVNSVKRGLDNDSFQPLILAEVEIPISLNRFETNPAALDGFYLHIGKTLMENVGVKLHEKIKETGTEPFCWEIDK